MESHQNFGGIDGTIESLPTASATTTCEKTKPWSKSKQDAQKGIHCTHQPQARQDAPLPELGRSERKGEAYFWYVEPLSEARTKPGKGHVSARLGQGGWNKAFFSIL